MAIRVRVQNFQSIKDSSIEIDGFTVVTGSNNRGKSALMRAIHGVFTNTKGTSFVRHGADYSSVEIEFDSGEKVCWEKGPKIKPRYIVNDGEPIYSGREVPPEVAALDIRPIVAGGQPIWPQVARQIVDVAFLVDQPGSVIAEAVSDVERVGALNRALKTSESDRRSASSTLKVRRTDEQSLVGELETYEGLDEVIDQSSGIEGSIEKAAHLHGVIGKVTDLHAAWVKATSEVEHLAGVDEIKIPRWDLYDLLKELQEMRGLRTRLQDSRQAVESLTGIDEASVPNFNGSVVAATNMASTLVDLRSLRDRILIVRAQIIDTQKDIETTDTERSSADKAVEDLLGDHGECPVCGTVF
jgi:DNA repair exonuclease SbcCD ATPase subunit